MNLLRITILFVSIAALSSTANAGERAKKLATPLDPRAVTDPLLLIYRVPGVRDDGGGFDAGTATTFHCSNFSNVSEKLAFQIRQSNGPVIKDVAFNVPAFGTFTVSTHFTAAYPDDGVLGTGVVQQGSASIRSTTTLMICSAMTINASTTYPLGVDLHMVRFNVRSGSTE
jgi:hypothetical protein